MAHVQKWHSFSIEIPLQFINKNYYFYTHSPLYRAKAELDEALVVLDSFEGFHDALDSKKLIMAPFCGEIACEDNIKRDSAR